MSKATYFGQECPTCGRQLQVRVEYLGKMVACQHCRGPFEAYDPACNQSLPSDSGIGLIDRANELLSSNAYNKTLPR